MFNASVRSGAPLVLIVHDDLAVLLTAGRILRHQGFQILVAPSMRGAAQIARRQTVDLVIADRKFSTELPLAGGHATLLMDAVADSELVRIQVAREDGRGLIEAARIALGLVAGFAQPCTAGAGSPVNSSNVAGGL